MSEVQRVHVLRSCFSGKVVQEYYGLCFDQPTVRPECVIDDRKPASITSIMHSLLLLVATAAGLVSGHGHDQTPIAGPHKSLWYNRLPGDGGTQADSVFSGISTFGRLPYHPCLASDDVKYDIAFMGAPFDTGTSYRPGARFGPSGIRQGSMWNDSPTCDYSE